MKEREGFFLFRVVRGDILVELILRLVVLFVYVRSVCIIREWGKRGYMGVYLYLFVFLELVLFL